MKLPAKIQLRKLLLIGFPLLSLGFFIYYAVTNFYGIPSLKWDSVSVGVAFSSVFLAAFNIWVGGVIWHLLLGDNGVSLPFGKAQVIFSISQFGKYLPGNVGQHIGRVGMAKEIGIPISITFHTIFIEMLWGAGVSAGLALAALFFLGVEKASGFQLQIGPLPLMFLVALLLSMPWLIIGALNRFFPRWANRLTGGGTISPPKLRTALMAAALFLLCFLTMGLILKLQARWLFGVADGGLLELTCLFSLAWLAGYITPGAPGGLGVREAMMVLLLTPVLGGGAAVGLGMTLRVTTTMGDILAFALGICGGKFSDKRKKEAGF
ncbi:MAG: flippase-like domain-containing protein [Deltaproteobacteria bacterium]|nr:flippase-like domain-containing protein [Deltaproteobacteria bacterium]